MSITQYAFHKMLTKQRAELNKLSQQYKTFNLTTETNYNLHFLCVSEIGMVIKIKLHTKKRTHNTYNINSRCNTIRLKLAILVKEQQCTNTGDTNSCWGEC